MSKTPIKNKNKENAIKSKGSILVICAHSDDQVIGPGGAMAKYANEGYDVHTIILSFGEAVQPHIKREVIAKSRVKEAQKADKIIGGKGVIFMGLKEGKFEKDLKERDLEKSFKKLIRKFKPKRIFTHAHDDVHPDHRATFRIVLRTYNAMNLKAELYSFEIWHLFNLKRRSKPKLVIDTSETFNKKINAIKAFKSQIELSSVYNYLIFNNFLFFMVHIKDTINGIKHNTKYAEVFYKIR